MTFKRHAMGPLEERPVSVQFEADFHQLLRPALIECSQKGNKKREGYIMGAFREALAKYRVKTVEQTARSIEFTPQEAQILLNIVSNMQKAAQNEEIATPIAEHREEFRRQVEMFSALKVKFMVLMLMEVKDEQVE